MPCFGDGSFCRLISALTVFSLLSAYCSAAKTEASFALGAAMRTLARHIRHQYSQNPAQPWLGRNPGRDPGRGVWSTAQLSELDQMNAGGGSQLQASLKPYFTSWPSTSVDSSSGPSYPWEGGAPTAGGSVNTENGNKLTAIHLLDWKGPRRHNARLHVVSQPPKQLRRHARQ